MLPQLSPGLPSLYLWPALILLALTVWLVVRTRALARLFAAFRRFVQFWSDLLLPLRNMAREMRRMNDLKVLELSERLNPKTGEPSPVIPVTEEPGNNDTEVFWGVEPKAHGIAALRNKLQREWEAGMPEDDDDDSPTP